MIALPYQFEHPFCGTVSVRRLQCQPAETCQLPYHSNGLTTFTIPLPISEDGHYRVDLEWEYDDHLFTHRSEICVRTGKLVTE